METVSIKNENDISELGNALIYITFINCEGKNLSLTQIGISEDCGIKTCGGENSK